MFSELFDFDDTGKIKLSQGVVLRALKGQTIWYHDIKQYHGNSVKNEIRC
jgi:hypothetical protein